VLLAIRVLVPHAFRFTPRGFSRLGMARWPGACAPSDRQIASSVSFPSLHDASGAPLSNAPSPLAFTQKFVKWGLLNASAYRTSPCANSVVSPASSAAICGSVSGGYTDTPTVSGAPGEIGRASCRERGGVG